MKKTIKVESVCLCVNYYSSNYVISDFSQGWIKHLSAQS